MKAHLRRPGPRRTCRWPAYCTACRRARDWTKPGALPILGLKQPLLPALQVLPAPEHDPPVREPACNTRARIKDPAVVEILAPDGAASSPQRKRLSLEQNFFDIFNQPNVSLVDLRKTPISRSRE
jgi:hypothetical protein